MPNLTTKCPGCGLETFIGERIRHAPGCAVASAAAAAKRDRMAARKTPVQLNREIKIALTECEDPILAAALRKDFRDHDK